MHMSSLLSPRLWLKTVRSGIANSSLRFQRAPASLPAELRVYAIGDIHGCRRTLELMHRRIAQDLAARPVVNASIIHLGDYVDKGPDSAGVLNLLLDPLPELRGTTVVNLLGNHEAMLLAALRGSEQQRRHWLTAGGDACLKSWGICPDPLDPSWRQQVPERHRTFLASLPLMHRQGGYVFVHAGIRPGLSLAEQVPADLLWIREQFLDFNGPLPAVVVHGHTPARYGPDVRANRISIDTGAAYGGALTCLVLEEDRMGFFSIQSDAR